MFPTPSAPTLSHVPDGCKKTLCVPALQVKTTVSPTTAVIGPYSRTDHARAISSAWTHPANAPSASRTNSSPIAAVATRLSGPSVGPWRRCAGVVSPARGRRTQPWTRGGSRPLCSLYVSKRELRPADARSSPPAVDLDLPARITGIRRSLCAARPVPVKNAQKREMQKRPRSGLSFAASPTPDCLCRLAVSERTLVDERLVLSTAPVVVAV